MPPLEATGPNAEQIRYWNEVSAPKWIAFQQTLDAQLGSLGRLTMDRGAIGRGERVLDVGCGCGDTTIEIGRRVGAHGLAVGVDVSTPMLDRAVELSRQAGTLNARFWNADAQTHAFPAADFDVVFSRFGVMFFTDATRAFANLRSALRPGGRVAFVCWQGVERNPWMAVPMMAAATVIPLPPRSAPDAPGPFSFADPERVRRILAETGFIDIALEEWTGMLAVGGEGTLDQAVDFLLELGPAAAALREAGGDAPARVAPAVKQALLPFHDGRGLRMSAAIWIVTARRPPLSAEDSLFLEELGAVLMETDGASRALGRVVHHFQAESGTLHLLHDDGLLHLAAASDGIPGPVLALVRTVPVGKGMAGLAVERRQPVETCNLQNDSSGDVRPGARATGLRGAIAVPVLAGDAAVGALGIGNQSERTFSGDETALLLAVGRVIGEHAPRISAAAKP